MLQIPVRLYSPSPGKLLAPIYSGFTEGFDTADLQGARTLLKKLS